jgi:hypothetical protein
MKKNMITLMMLFTMSSIILASCSRKSGCPSNGKNVGAERLMSGEKVPKAKKFKV